MCVLCVASKRPRRDGVSAEIITLLGELEERADQRWQAMEEKRLKLVVEIEQDRRREERKHEDDRRREERKHEERMMQMMTSAMGLFQNVHAYTPAHTYMPPPPTTPSYSPTQDTFNPHAHVQPYGAQSPLNTTHCQPSPHTLSFPSDEEHN